VSLHHSSRLLEGKRHKQRLTDENLLDTTAFADFQIGLPTLFEAGSEAHFQVLHQWLKLCDTRHGHSTSEDYSDHARLPTRLIDVKPDTAGDDIVRLWETGPEDRGQFRYAALSHPWGAPPHFCTYTHSLAAHKEGIALAQLPATFRHAVQTTRALGLRHLWIDSICIVQGADGDFRDEAQRMERVFRGAYCVLAASCALGQSDGFLKPRRERDYVAMRSRPAAGGGGGDGGLPYYVCEIVDDFNSHALQGHLNSRGWVLQEHALARRTIFFTEHQTYWECGDGVRCETGTRSSK
jgi:hypothetical protein